MRPDFKRLEYTEGREACSRTSWMHAWVPLGIDEGKPMKSWTRTTHTSSLMPWPVKGGSVRGLGVEGACLDARVLFAFLLLFLVL